VGDAHCLKPVKCKKWTFRTEWQ